MSTKLGTGLQFRNEFLRKYESALRSIVATVNEEKPDYIIALSRKAPRLLELLRLSGLWSGNIPVISEKALDFIPTEQLRHRKVIIFDDIIISGTTVKHLVAELMHQYAANLAILCLGVDVDTIALKKDPNGNYVVTLEDGGAIPVHHKVPLKQDDRFIFCNEIVRSFAFLNKPYDIDFPIFYGHLNSRPLGSSLVQTRVDKSYDLTTVYQYNAGFSRYTLLPNEAATIDVLCNAIIGDSSLSPHICKVREYVNRKTGEVAFCSMVTFQVSAGLLSGNKLFTDVFALYDELVAIARPFVHSKSETQAIYRLVCYVVSYLCGLSFSLRSMEGGENFAVLHPSDVLSMGDLSYVFGPGLSETILQFLDLHHTETLDVLRRTQDTCDTVVSGVRSKQVATERSTLTLDESRQELYNMILPHIAARIHAQQSLTDRIAVIFEGLYYSGEIPIQDSVRKDGIKGDEYRRLGVGFNYGQIMEILRSNSLLGSDSGNSDLGISVALDFLVDAGVAIPIFFYERADGFYERAYRYGEDALSAKKYGYLIASTVKSLSEYVRENRVPQVLPKITFEKVGVLLQEEIMRTGVVDLLKELLPAGDREMSISPHFARHGKILHISDEAYERSQCYPFMFNEWSEREGIVNSVLGGVTYSNTFFDKLRFPDGYLPQLMPPDKVAAFESLAMLLWRLDREVDKKGHSDYLIALSACGDRESYLWALREELSLFFKSKDYGFAESLGRTVSYSRQAEHRTEDFLGQALKWCNRSLSAAHGTRHKKALIEKLPQIVDDIEKHFAGNGQLRLLYDQNLRFHIDKIKAAYSVPAEPTFGRLKSEAEALGEACILLASVLESLLELAIQTHRTRLTKEGRFHQASIAATTRRVDGLRRCLEEWNAFVGKDVVLDMVSLSPLPSEITDQSPLWQSTDGRRKNTNELVASVIAVMQDDFAKLDQVYDRNYSPATWRQKMIELFPDADSLELAAVKGAIEAANNCISEDHRVHPKVGAAIIKDGRIVCTAYRGEKRPGDHAEYTALFDKTKALKMDLRGSTLITTLEPCTSRKHDNKPCALHIVERGIERVIVGMVDPNPEIRGKGILYLQRKSIKVDLFPANQQEQVRRLNQEFWDQEWQHYKMDLMKDPGASEKQVQNIAGEFYSQDARRIRVFEELRRRLDKGEDKILSETYLGINYEDLPGDTRIDKINSLVTRFARRDRLDDLLEAIGRFNQALLRSISSGDLPE